eukprot:5321808-Amphidinium_carterae.1
MHKVRASPARSRKISLAEQASIDAPFQGLQIDHKFIDQHSPYLTVKDIYSGWLYAYPVMDKSSGEVEAVLRHVIGARGSYRIVVSDSAPEPVSAAAAVGLAHFPLTPERPQQNGHVERAKL